MSPAPVLPRRLEVRGKGCQPVEGTPNSPLRTSRGRCISPTRAAKPASEQELTAKFRTCAGRVLDSGRTESAIGILRSLDRLADVRMLTNALSLG